MEEESMGFELLCMGLIALMFGVAVTFFGYRLFLFLLPIWGFIFGFGLGAQALQVVFGEGFLATTTSWVAGFVVGAIFAVLSYLFYIVAVAILSFSAGYGITQGLFDMLEFDLTLIYWIVAVVVGIVVAYAVLRFNIQKYAIIVITAMGGTSAIMFTLLAGFGDLSPMEMLVSPVALAIADSFWWALFFVVVAAAGIFVQLRSHPEWTVEEYNRFEV
jgi:hypothetical protein